jgi:hypothetical protein
MTGKTPTRGRHSGVMACSRCKASIVYVPVRGPAMPVVELDAAATLSSDPSVVLYSLDGHRVRPSAGREVAGHRPHRMTCRARLREDG